MALLIVDISWCQGLAIDWQRVKASGCVAVIIKVTEGLTGVDPTARKNIDGARAAGLIVAVYDFARPSQGHPEDQFDAMWKAMGDRVPAFCPLDLESAPAGMTPVQIVEFAERWETRAKEVSGRYQPFYSFDWFITHQMGAPLVNSKIMAQCPLWIAQPSWNRPGLPPPGMEPLVHKPWSRYTLWQFSSDGAKGVPGTLVPGIPTVVDRNVFNGSMDDLRAFLGQPTADQLEPEGGTIHVLDYSHEDDPPFPPDDPPAAA